MLSELLKQALARGAIGLARSRLNDVGLHLPRHPVVSGRAPHEVLCAEPTDVVALLHLVHTSYAKDPDMWALGDHSAMAVADGHRAIIATPKRGRVAPSTTDADEAATHWTPSWPTSSLGNSQVCLPRPWEL